MMPNSDDYLATLLAAGPGLIPAAVLLFVDGPANGLLPQLPGIGRIVLAYPALLIAALPGLPILGYGLPRSITDVPAENGDSASIRLRPAWLFVAAIGSLWHLAVWELSLALMPWLDPLAPPDRHLS